MKDVGGFDHNAHTLRLLTRLETPYPRYSGLNLSWETLEGLAKHNGPVPRPSWALAEANGQFPLDLGTWPGLEAQIAAVSDDIAYDNHDVDDGLRAGLFTLHDLLDVPLIARCWEAVRARFPDVGPDRLLPELVRHQIGLMVNDVLVETARRIAASGVETADDVRHYPGALAGFSDDMVNDERLLKAFLYERMYKAPEVEAVRVGAQRVVAGLAAAYRNEPSLLPRLWQPADPSPVSILRAIGDFIAGMTDRYAIRQYRELVGPVELPEGF
jgi:dGTPase